MKVPLKLSRRKEILLDFLLVFIYTAMLIRPYFKARYTDKWASIESTFIADARFLSEHWPHPQWQPLWYAGTRFDYIYPPAVRYGAAVISKVTGFWPVTAYHFYVAFFYALGIAGVYLLMRVGSKSRPFAYLGAVATSLMSPIFLFMPRFREDSWMLQPQRLGVLVKYGEGPHMSALALIPIALAFAWLALEKRRPWAVALAAVFSAGVAANNFYGAAALAVFYPILVWSFWITRQEKRIVIPAIAIPILAYGLTAFWLVPSYFKVTAENLKYVSEHGTTWSIWVAVVVAVAFAVTTDKFARARPERAWAVFVTGCVVFFSLYVLGGFYFNFRISGEPVRLLPELDMIYVMAAVLILQWMWNRPGIALRAVVLVVVIAAFWTTTGYIRHAWHMFPLWPDYQNRVEYRVTDWLWKNMPDARAYASGSVRFWYDAWHDLAQLGGGSDQGLLNGEVAAAPWETNLLYVAFFYALGIAGVYLLMRVASKSRPFAYLGVLATSLMSPIFLFVPRFPGNAWRLQPQRLDVLVKYVEGLHMSALALIPMALAFSWLALEKRRPWAVALAAVFSAGVAANNFYGAAALAVFYPILVWSFWITRQEKRIVVPAIAIPVLACGLMAFWLAPWYFKLTAENMKYISEHGTTWSIWVAVVVAVAFAVTTDKFVRAKPERTWAVFIAGCVVFFSLNVLGGLYFNFRISGEPVRLLPELDMIYVMAAVLILQWMWNRPGIALRAVALVIVVAVLWTTGGYVRHAWHDLAQLGGSSGQGLPTGAVSAAQWEANLGAKPDPSILWMQCMGVDAIYVSDKRSQEMYKDFEYPQKFAGVLPVLYDDRQGNTLYRVPRRFPARARVVEARKLNVLKPPRFNDDVEYLGAYAGVIEHGPDSPPTLTRDGTDAMRLRAKVELGQSIVVQESWDPAWQAWAGGNPLPVRKDAMGFMAVDPPPGDQEIRLAFVTPLENRAGRIVTLATLLALLSLVVFGVRWERFV